MIHDPSGKRWLDSLDNEIQHHVEQETAENIERGMEPGEARYAALRKFGNVSNVREDTRAVWSIVWVEQLLQDIRYGVRTLQRRPWFTFVVVATIALGIGMNTGVFSVVNAALLRPLPYPDAGRLIWLSNYDQRFKHDNWVARTDYVSWRRQAQSFDKMTAYGNQDLAVVIGDQASQERVASITGDFWNLTRVRPAHGRLFASGEPNAIVLSRGLFERRLGGDARMIGKTITLNGWPFTVVGVLPKDFSFLFPQQFVNGDEVRDIDAYISIPDALMALPPAGVQHWQEATGRLGPAPFWISVVGRLKANTSVETAYAEMQTVYTRVTQQDPGPLRTHSILRFATLEEKLSGSARKPLFVLSVAAGFVLVIACANIANLLLARASTQQRDIAIRVAIGAGRLRVIRQFLTESVLLALLGCAAGIFLAHWALAILINLAPHAVPRLAEATIDGPVLCFTLGISLAAAVAFGLAPAISAWKSDVNAVLKAETTASSATPRRAQIRRMLAAAELALAIILLVGAGLMLKSFWRMNAKPPGFTPEKILVMRITLSGPQYTSWPPKQAYTEELLKTLHALPGVEAAGIDAGTLNTGVRIGGSAKEDAIFSSVRGVSPGYLRAMGIPLVEGNWPERGALFGAVVNEAFARRLPRQSSGRFLSGSILNDSIMGVVADFKTWRLDANPMPEVYVPYERLPNSRSLRIVLRTSGEAASMAPAVRKVIAEIDPTQPAYEVQTLEEALSGSIAPRRFNLFLLGAFAVAALMLALIGVYGVIAYSVEQRTREIGVRLALGARRREIVGMVVRQGMALAIGGIAVGLLIALGLTRLMTSLLYDVRSNDPWTLSLVTAGLAVTALLATAVPALKASKVDPLTALRHE
ncbi:MAG TPA: ABC transporter permease [Bryobacteraceae bacterium]|nr:ABC transporter permease [Bryobacteraceae bacterium]